MSSVPYSSPMEIASVHNPLSMDVSDPLFRENFYVKIAGGNVEVQNGLAEKATTTISGSDQTLSDLLTGKLDPVKAFMSGQIKVSGDVFAAQKITSIMKKAGA